MILMENVFRDRGGQRVLRGVDLSVDRGEFLSVRGRSGAGKTTLLRVMGLLDPPDSGKVVSFGKRVRDLDDGAKSRLRLERIGFVFQFHNLIPSLSVFDNVGIPLELAGVGGEERGKRVEYLLEYFEVSHLRDRRPGTLSGGERQRVAVARALANEPDLVLADEPEAGLDPENSGLVIGMLEKINSEKGTSVVFTTTDLDKGLPTDRDYLLEGGALKAWT